MLAWAVETNCDAQQAGVLLAVQLGVCHGVLHGAASLHAGMGKAWHASLGLDLGIQAVNRSAAVRSSVLRRWTLHLLSTADPGCLGQHSCKGSCRGAAAQGQVLATKICQGFRQFRFHMCPSGHVTARQGPLQLHHAVDDDTCTGPRGRLACSHPRECALQRLRQGKARQNITLMH